MTATSRFKKGIPIVPERDDRLVALVGFPSPLSANGRGLLQRCELTALELPDIRDACHVLDTLAADAVVLDSRCLTSPLYEQCALTLLQLLPLAPDRATTRIPLILLTSRRLTQSVRVAYTNAGAVVLPVPHQNYRQIASLVRQRCGFSDGCCRGSIPQDQL